MREKPLVVRTKKPVFKGLSGCLRSLCVRPLRKRDHHAEALGRVCMAGRIVKRRSINLNQNSFRYKKRFAGSRVQLSVLDLALFCEDQNKVLCP